MKPETYQGTIRRHALELRAAGVSDRAELVANRSGFPVYVVRRVLAAAPLPEANDQDEPACFRCGTESRVFWCDRTEETVCQSCLDAIKEEADPRADEY